MVQLPDGRRLVPEEHVAVADLEGALVLLHMQSGVYFGLSEVGARIWQLLGEQADEATILERLIAEYDVPRDVLQTDVRRFLGELERHKLVRT
jgi:hypothetical protein